MAKNNDLLIALGILGAGYFLVKAKESRAAASGSSSVQAARIAEAVAAENLNAIAAKEGVTTKEAAFLAYRDLVNRGIINPQSGVEFINKSVQSGTQIPSSVLTIAKNVNFPGGGVGNVAAFPTGGVFAISAKQAVTDKQGLTATDRTILSNLTERSRSGLSLTAFQKEELSRLKSLAG